MTTTPATPKTPAPTRRTDTGTPSDAGRMARLPAASPRSGEPHRRRQPRRKQTKSVPGAVKVYVKRSRATGRETFYGDFREFADVGGRCEPLRAPGARFATAALREALDRYAARRAEYEARRAGAAAEAAAAERPALGPLLARHITEKHAAGRRAGTLRRLECAAHVLLDHFGNAALDAVMPRAVQTYVRRREQEPGVRTGSLTSSASIRIELSLLSDALRRAKAYGWVTGENPVALAPDKPAAPPPRKVWLTRAEAARLLDAGAEHDAAARRDADACAAWGVDPQAAVWQDTKHAPKKHGRAVQWERRRDDAEAILATLLYTGGRISEVLGLTAGEVDFAAEVVRFRENAFRALKRTRHERDVQLWPPLATILRAHVARLGLAPADPLFPTAPGARTPVTRIDKPLARCCRRAGVAAKNVSPHALRHTYATMLLRTYARAADGHRIQRSAFDAAKALGHGSSHLIDRVYGHAAWEDCTETLSYEAERVHPITTR